MASQNSGENRGQPGRRGKGRPFQKGKMPGVGKPFGKGASGNPGGRPTTRWIRDYLDEMGSAEKPVPRRMSLLGALWLTAIDRRHKDHVRACEALLAYDVGKPVQAVELTGAEGGPVETVETMTSEKQNARLRELLAKAAAAAAGEAPEGGSEPGDGEPDGGGE